MADDLAYPSFTSPGGQSDAGSPTQGATTPPGQGNPDSLEKLQLVQGIVRNTRLLAQKVPGAVDIIRQINDLTQKLQVKIMQGGAPPTVQAPPVA